MSGSKQHFIPQSLLKGFGVVRGKSTLVVAYTRDRGIFTPATDGIAAERHFYSELAVDGEDETLDDRITDYETPLSVVLGALRSLDDGEATNPAVTAEFVTHLAVRNDNLRKSITTASMAMVEGVAGLFSDTASAKHLLGLDDATPEGVMAEQLTEAFERYGPLIEAMGMDQATFSSWAFANLQSNFEEYHSQTQVEMDVALSTVLGSAPGVAANSQRTALTNELAPARRVEHMSAYGWRTVDTEYPLILPDCVAIGYDTEGNPGPLTLIDLDDLETIYLPLSTDRLLVGSRSEAGDIPVDLVDVMASCSWDFFVARECTPELEALRERLRTLASFRLDTLVDSAISGAIAKSETAKI